MYIYVNIGNGHRGPVGPPETVLHFTDYFLLCERRIDCDMAVNEMCASKNPQLF